ncbi:MAG: PIG-L family deacetylase [Pyrinomonadaceae bacterium]
MKVSKHRILIPFILLFSIFHFPFSVRSQVRPIYDYGASGLGQLLKKLGATKSVMMVGAHPDDEDSALLAYLARGENARTAYLSLTRGDGGQNIIGSELFESLGIIRTEELLQARKLDGAEQFFTRAFDFGFTKTLAETKQKWDEKIILCDAVRAIRIFRPLVVISRFSGTPADGHGQHQFAGYISPLAVKAASDANQCVGDGFPWQVLKFYVEQGFRSTEQPTLKINTGAYDFLLGRSYFEIAAEGRSLHRTQEQGSLELKGEHFSGLNLVESKATKIADEKSVFDGIDTSITSIPKLLGLPEDFSKEEFNNAQESVKIALKEYEPNNPQGILSNLVKGSWNLWMIMITKCYPHFEDAEKGQNYKDAFFLLLTIRLEFQKAIRLASGIQIDALADRETAAPNESFQTAVKIFFPDNPNIKVKEIALKSPDGWTVSKIAPPQENSQNFFGRETPNGAAFFSVKIPPEAKPTEPYWLENPRKGDLFDWQNDNNRNLPFQPPLVSAQVKIEINGTEIILNQPVEYRFADPIRGEVRRELNVVPKISLNLDQNLILVSGAEKSRDRDLILTVMNNSSSSVSGTAKLDLPNGWQSVSAAPNFSLENKGEKTSVKFVLTIPRNYKIGSYEIGAKVATNGETFTQTMNTIAYPHIQTHRFYTDAKVKIDVLDLKVAPVKVGYIMGSGDSIPEAVRQMGLSVDLLGEKDLSGGDLSKYDVIVVGIRAYQVRDDLISNNQKVLDYVKNGGTLIVQYQRPDYVARNLQPFPASMTDTQKTTAGTTARVVDENAKVTILEPLNPIFNFPNKITDADFEGWVQERNLYNFVTFDKRYTPLLESHDAGEQENKGGMVYAKLGKGNYIYTSYSFFRQLPAGNAGAFRLFANLLSLPKYNLNRKSKK